MPRALALFTVVMLVASCASTTVNDVSGAASPAGTAVASGAGAGGALFSGPQPWTVDVSADPTSERSAAILAALTNAGGWGNGNVLQTDFSISVFNAAADTPQMEVVGRDDYCGGGPDCDALPARMPIPADASIEGSEGLTCDVANEDCHLIVADREQRTLYELYQATKIGNQLTAQAFFAWDLDREYSDVLRGVQCTSADAAGFPIAALTPTADEVASGDVGHALRFILPNDRMKEGVFVPPASHAGGPANPDPDAPPYGVNFRLRADFDDSGYTDGQRVILNALKKYGMYLSDGGEIALTFADDRNSSAKWADLGIDAQSFANISVEDFEVVDHGPEVELTYDCVRE